MSVPPAVECRDLKKAYGRGRGRIVALGGVGLTVAQGELTAIVGPSGSGKSTLLHIIGAMDRPDAGTVRVGGCDLAELNDSEASRFRREHLGFVFQFFNLIPTLTALDNIALPSRLCGASIAQARERAQSLLNAVDLGDRSKDYPETLSGGQQQRVAIARALVNSPRLVLADEPTGALDSAAGGEILQFLARLAREQGVTLLMVTHSEGALAIADRCLRIEDGRIV